MRLKDAYQTVFREYPDVLSVGQMSKLLSVSTRTAYGLLQRGEIDALKIGRAYKIPKANLLQYLGIVAKV
jgi:excisionase family DNA binding protein